MNSDPLSDMHVRLLKFLLSAHTVFMSQTKDMSQTLNKVQGHHVNLNLIGAKLSSPEGEQDNQE